jgi:hypothetical protein
LKLEVNVDNIYFRSFLTESTLLLREMMAICCENCTKHIGTQGGKNAGFLNVHDIAIGLKIFGSTHCISLATLRKAVR